MCGPSYCTLLLIAASCYVLVVCSQAKSLQGTSKLDLANHISAGGSARGSSSSSQSPSAAAAAAMMSEARQKRAMGEYKELTDIIDELEENSLAQKASATIPVAGMLPPGQEFDLDSMPPLTYYLLLQKLRQLQSSGEPAYRVRTPRLGRSIDFQRLLDGGEGAAVGMAGSEEATGGQFMQRMIKKSVPFKPRLGKRAQVCGGD
ncbi:protein hugin [Drosophila ficusphila]|uniref:protein hugin n=1 Tax=Drosophila ficusphila TaxID=30025 RepID=UPI0007E7AADF|nr:protein hugin [Drosophila ficusphila]